MSEESTTPDLVELTRRGYESFSRRDLDAVMRFWGPDSVWDMSHTGMGAYEGREAIRRFFEDWWGAYDEYAGEAEAILDLGNGVTFAVFIQRARPLGSSGDVHCATRRSTCGSCTPGCGSTTPMACSPT